MENQNNIQQQSPLPPVSPPPSKPYSHMLTIILVGLLMLGVGLGGGYLLFATKNQQTQMSNAQQVAQPSTPNTPTPIVKPDGLAIYSSTGYGISFDYPSNLTQYCTDKYQCSFNPPSEGRGPENFIYISIIPGEMATVSAGTIYNYDSFAYKILSDMKIGESNNTNSTVKVGFTYTRLPDITVDGTTAKVYENKNPWEAVSPTYEKRVYTKKNGTIYLFGGYIGKDINEDTFNKTVSSITFTK